MEIIWKYKIDLLDESVFDEIGNERSITIPTELKKLIKVGNAATPSNCKFMVGVNERVLGAILSFNKGEPDTDTVFTALKTVNDRNLLPFAIDPFGNYICYDVNKSIVVFWNHETNEISSTGKDLGQFLESLY